MLEIPKVEGGERNNILILLSVLGDEGAVALGLGALLTVLISPEIEKAIFGIDFSSRLIESVIGIAGILVAVTSSSWLRVPGNKHLEDDWRDFRSPFTRVIFMAFIVTLMAFVLPILGLPQKLDIWLKLSVISLLFLGFWYAVRLIRRVIGHW